MFIQPHETNEKKIHIAIILCLASTFVFALQDAVTKILTANVHVAQFTMIRYWFLFLFSLYLLKPHTRIIQKINKKNIIIHILRSIILFVEIVLFAYGLRYLSLPDMHSIFVLYPIMIILLAVLFLGEKLNWKIVVATIVSFAGALLILRPGSGVFGIEAVLPIVCALLYAIYSILTRYVGTSDSLGTTVFFTALGGVILGTVWGIFEWDAIEFNDAIYVIILAALGVLGQILVIQSLNLASASVLQPFNYFTLVWAIILGIVIFDSIPNSTTISGAIIVAAAGIGLMILKKQGGHPH